MEECPEIDGIAVVVPKERLSDVQQMAQLFGFSKLRKIAAGMSHRSGSLKNGMKVLDEAVSIVALQDVSRPLVEVQTISDCIKTGKRYGAAIAAARIDGVVKEVQKGTVISDTVVGRSVWQAQTPFVCRRELLEAALDSGAKNKGSVLDEAHAVELQGNEVRVSPSSIMNIKIAEGSDLALAELLVKKQQLL